MRFRDRLRKGITRKSMPRLGVAVALGLLLSVVFAPLRLRAADDATLLVVVKDAADNQPIYQAQLTLQFRIPQKYRQDKWISYSAKTDKKGECTFHHITKGPIVLMVTANDHQSFGKKYKIEKDNPVIEVKLRKPQPQI